MTTTPYISVVMAVYNGEKYLAEAIESILQQTFRDFEFIIVDDASTDSSAEILQSYQAKDDRIKIIKNEVNSGLGVSLQRGIQCARGELIARMDADDISSLDRFQKQIDYLSAHPEIWIVGGDFITVDEDGAPTSEMIFPKDSELMRWNMLLGSGLIVSNGAAMIRKKVFEIIGNFGDFRAAQDFELWTRLFDLEMIPIANLVDKIYYYRRYSGAITTSQISLQEKNAISVRRKKIEVFLGSNVSEEAVLAYRHPAFVYQNIKEDILIWFLIYKKFIARFKVTKETKTSIYNEILSRISKYTALSPFQSSKSRILFGQLLFFLPPDILYNVLLSKLEMIRKKR